MAMRKIPDGLHFERRARVKDQTTPSDRIVLWGRVRLFLIGDIAMKYKDAVAVLLVTALSGVAAAAQAQDAAAGEKVYQARCAMCHTKTAVGGPMAPSLVGIVGAKAASRGWDKYSPALKASGKVWNPASLDEFLAAPAKVVPGTRMVIPVPNPADRKALIAYMATLK